MTEKPGKAAGTAKRKFLPGDPEGKAALERMIRVDQAGEYGARRIYEGQMAVLGPKHPQAAILKHMYEQERAHLAAFDEMTVKRGVRPTVLQPVWHVAGFALGAATALMGEKAAMACTVAVEEVIDEHYAQQHEALGDDDPELSEMIEKFRTEELEHRDIALQQGAEDTPGYELLSAGIKAGSRLAIWLSKRF
ncbi:MAG: demethoxyubiquinone hydroxylase family protein [Kiloniellales bacterium]|nr:demethoxyubiquinone hydroxylase family protein [Kiloniellales bacterium]